MSNELNRRFNIWWDNEGKEGITKHIDLNETKLNTIKKIVQVAWLNGAYVQREEYDNDKRRKDTK